MAYNSEYAKTHWIAHFKCINYIKLTKKPQNKTWHKPYTCPRAFAPTFLDIQNLLLLAAASHSFPSSNPPLKGHPLWVSSYYQPSTFCLILLPLSGFVHREFTGFWVAYCQLPSRKWKPHEGRNLCLVHWDLIDAWHTAHTELMSDDKDSALLRTGCGEASTSQRDWRELFHGTPS